MLTRDDHRARASRLAYAETRRRRLARRRAGRARRRGADQRAAGSARAGRSRRAHRPPCRRLCAPTPATSSPMSRIRAAPAGSTRPWPGSSSRPPIRPSWSIPTNGGPSGAWSRARWLDRGAYDKAYAVAPRASRAPRPRASTPRFTPAGSRCASSKIPRAPRRISPPPPKPRRRRSRSRAPITGAAARPKRMGRDDDAHGFYGKAALLSDRLLRPARGAQTRRAAKSRPRRPTRSRRRRRARRGDARRRALPRRRPRRFRRRPSPTPPPRPGPTTRNSPRMAQVLRAKAERRGQCRRSASSPPSAAIRSTPSPSRPSACRSSSRCRARRGWRR